MWWIISQGGHYNSYAHSTKSSQNTGRSGQTAWKTILSRVVCPICHECPNSCSISACRGQTAPVLKNMGHPRGQFQGHKNPQGNLQLLLMEPTNIDKVSNNHELLCTSSQEQLNDGGIIYTYAETSNRKNQASLAFFSRPFLVPKSNNRWRPILGLSSLNKCLK